MLSSPAVRSSGPGGQVSLSWEPRHCGGWDACSVRRFKRSLVHSRCAITHTLRQKETVGNSAMAKETLQHGLPLGLWPAQETGPRVCDLPPPGACAEMPFWARPSISPNTLLLSPLGTDPRTPRCSCVCPLSLPGGRGLGLSSPLPRWRTEHLDGPSLHVSGAFSAWGQVFFGYPSPPPAVCLG